MSAVVVDNRPNQQQMRPPFGKVIAACFGSGKAGSTAEVLIYVAESEGETGGEKYAVLTWNATLDKWFNGDYLHRFQFGNELEATAWTKWTERARLWAISAPVMVAA